MKFHILKLLDVCKSYAILFNRDLHFSFLPFHFDAITRFVWLTIFFCAYTMTHHISHDSVLLLHTLAFNFRYWPAQSYLLSDIETTIITFTFFVHFCFCFLLDYSGHELSFYDSLFVQQSSPDLHHTLSVRFSIIKFINFQFHLQLITHFRNTLCLLIWMFYFNIGANWWSLPLTHIVLIKSSFVKAWKLFSYNTIPNDLFF